MKSLTIFGKNYPIIAEKNGNGTIQFKKNQIVISPDCQQDKIITQFLTDLLYTKLVEIFEEIKNEGTVELLGSPDFEISKKIDDKGDRLAKMKGNRITVKLDTVSFPEEVLRYIVAHEMAHITNKRHTIRFWKTVKLICPDYEESQKSLSMFHVKHDRK
jgi:predicted metal-dependent hydrolase